ncbi:MAG: hypothetical protein AB7I25_03905 [Vicinamibacterales bacterium]
MRHILLATVAAVSAAAPTLHSQVRSDFSGIWILDETRSGLHEPASTAVRPHTVIITQREDEVQVNTLRGDRADPVTYTIGPTPPQRNRDSHGMIVVWNERILRTVLARTISDFPVSITEERQLSEAGREMAVRRQLSVEHGYDARGFNTSEAVTLVYVRQPR